MKVTVVCAPSLDGLLAHGHVEHVNWTSPDDKAWFKAQTTKAGVVVMGSNTYKTYPNPAEPLPGRLVIVMTNTPQPDTEHVLFRSGEPKVVLDELEQKGFKEVALIGGGGVNSTFLQANAIDELYLTIIPQWFDGGVPLFAHGVGEREFELLDSRPFESGEVLMHYKVKK